MILTDDTEQAELDALIARIDMLKRSIVQAEIMLHSVRDRIKSRQQKSVYDFDRRRTDK